MKETQQLKKLMEAIDSPYNTDNLNEEIADSYEVGVSNDGVTIVKTGKPIATLSMSQWEDLVNDFTEVAARYGMHYIFRKQN